MLRRSRGDLGTQYMGAGREIVKIRLGRLLAGLLEDSPSSEGDEIKAFEGLVLQVSDHIDAGRSLNELRLVQVPGGNTARADRGAPPELQMSDYVGG